VIGVTADTNIYVSALNFAGAPRRFLNAAIAGNVRLAISSAILDELRGVLQSKFRWSESAVAEAIALLSDCTTFIQPTETLDVVPDDPDDNRVVECAVAAGSQFIVTGDRDLLRLGNYGNIRILNVTDFLRMIEPPSQ